MAVRCFPLAALAAMGCLLGAVTPSGRAEPDKDLKRAIEKSVDRGVAYLKKNQARDGTWYHAGPATAGMQMEQNVGATAMCGIALLESGVDLDDSSVQRAASVVRGQARNLTYTYAIASAIIFLDRVGKGDSGTIAMLGNRLIQGQTNTFGWSYYCPTKGVQEDHSNTQFAVLALWIARRHGVKADRALQLAEKRFRECQQSDGSWGYQIAFGPMGRGTPSMTAAGMLALAFGFGTKHKAETELTGANPKDEGSDAPMRRQRPRADLKLDPQVLKAKDVLARYMSTSNFEDTHLVYFLWTLERVCMIYGYSQFNGVDWYNWGANLLLRNQRENGCWSGDFTSGPNCETAWALLFLRKSNLVADLDVGTSVLRGGSMKDVGRPGQGGVRPPPKQEKAEVGRVGKPGEAIALKEELRTSVVVERIEEILDLMEKTRNSADNDYTSALADVISQLRPSVQDQARRALQNRMSRLTVKTLGQYLSVDNKELRLAALEVLQTKGTKDQIPDIIPVLGARDPQVVDAALSLLKKLSGQDHGRDQGAWQRWWDAGGK